MVSPDLFVGLVILGDELDHILFSSPSKQWGSMCSS